MADLRRAFWDTMTQIADEDTIVLTGDLGYSFMEGFAEKHPDKFINAGIAEQNMVGVSAGLARGGKKPYVYSGALFLALRAIEQVRDDIAYQNLPVKLIGTGASGFLGFSHNLEGDEDLANIFKGMPNIQFRTPKDETDLKILLNADGPMFIKL